MATNVPISNASYISKTAGVCGGCACIRDTRIPVWSMVVAGRLGASDHDLLNYFVTPLTLADVAAAWAYFEANAGEIENDIRENENA